MTDVALAGWDDVALELSPEEIEYERLRNIDPMPYRRRVDDFRDGTVESRAIADKARRYFDGDQIWGATELALKRSRQPKVIRNEIAPAINGILGVIQQDRVDPKAYPRTPANEKQADVATKVLRFIADKEQWHSKKVDCAESFLIEGVSAASIEVNAKGEPVIIPVPYDEAIYDPRSRKADFSDSDYNGVGKWMYEGDLARMYPWAAEDLGRVYTTSWGDDMGLERPAVQRTLSARVGWTQRSAASLWSSCTTGTMGAGTAACSMLAAFLRPVLARMWTMTASLFAGLCCNRVWSRGIISGLVWRRPCYRLKTS